MAEPRSEKSPAKELWPPGSKLKLTPRGYSLENDYRSQVNMRSGAGAIAAYNAARSRWAKAHALKPALGAMLVTLRQGPRTLVELETIETNAGRDALAVSSDVAALLAAELITWRDGPQPETPKLTMRMGLEELGAAQVALDQCRRGVPGTHNQSSRERLRRALSRVIAARNLVGTLRPGSAAEEE